MKEDKIKEAFGKVKGEISEINNKINWLGLELKELRKQLREPTSRSTTRSSKQAPLKSIEKNALKRINKAQVMKAIKGYIDEGYQTYQIRDEVMNRFNIKETCFYKYLKLLREALREVTTRSSLKEEN